MKIVDNLLSIIIFIIGLFYSYALSDELCNIIKVI